MLPSANKTKAGRPETAVKVLLFDIETSPNLAFIWGKWEQDALGDFIKERQIISFAWKWMGEKEVHVLALPMLKTYKKEPENNRGLVLKLHELMLGADVVVGHNVDAFDDPMSNAEFLIHGLKPPPPHKTVDTLKFARHKFRFNSNKLGDLGKRLGLGAKVHTGGFELWAGCLRGDRKAWSLMMEYNKGDVALLEKIYLKLRPWMRNHPDMNALSDRPACPTCMADKTHMIVRKWRSLYGKRCPQFQCKSCGHYASGKLENGAWKFK